MNTKLWELSEDLTELDNAITTINDDETIPEQEKETLLNDLFEQWLESDDKFTDKAINTASYIKYLESLTDARKAEVKRLQQLAKQSESQAQRLRGYLVMHMSRLNKKKLEGVNVKLSIRRKPATLEINCDVEDLPTEYQRITIEPDKAKIKAFIKEHGDRSWAFMKDSDEFSLIIK